MTNALLMRKNTAVLASAAGIGRASLSRRTQRFTPKLDSAINEFMSTIPNDLRAGISYEQ